MKLNKGLLIVIFLIIINLLFGGVLLYIVTAIEAPNIVTNLDILDLNQDEIVIQIEINIDNPNFFSIIVQNFDIKCMNESGYLFGDMRIIGGEIDASSNGSFISNDSFSFENYDFDPIINLISGEIGFKFFGIIQKIIPINIQLITNIEDIVLDIKPPEIIINTEISEVTNDGISFAGDIIIFNPNNFKILMDDISLTIRSDLNDIVGNIEISSDEINPNSIKNISINGNLSYDVLNYDKAVINLKAKVGSRIGGFQKIINISSTTQFNIPDVKELLRINRTMNFSISADFKLQIDGILSNVGLIVYNPSEIPLQATNLICRISLVSNNKTNIIAENDMESSPIPSKNEVKLETNIKIPYTKFLILDNGKLFPDILFITIEGDFSIEGTNKSIPLTFNGYIDLNLFE